MNGSKVHIDIYDDRMEICSPSGMPDGSFIQEKDPLTVPSARRNPVLADIFSWLGYMERKGSGFGKIISGYEFQINYDESKKPLFQSDRYQFTVVVPNLNYSVTQDVTQDNLNTQILKLIRKDNKISTEKIALALGVSMRTVKRKHEITCILTWKGKEPAHICEQVLNFHLLDATFLRDTR